MTVACVMGIDNGDEGKAKVCDYLMEWFDISARHCGGSNAGHSVWVGGKKYVTHMLPTSILRPGKISVITAGVVVNIDIVKKDLEMVGKTINDEDVLIDAKCPIVTIEHIERDSGAESKRLGTTNQGVGPCNADQVNRVGKRYGDFSRKAVDTGAYLRYCINRGYNVLFEGAQGHQLDLIHGTYPFVTSACITVGSIFTNAGIPPKMLNDVYGVFKAYSTKVGTGPFPTEEKGQLGEYIREKGEEFGATTGRPRRIGWLDLVQIKEACEINGVNYLVMTKADILDGLASFPVATDRDLKGNPIYKEVKGWSKPIADLTDYNKLPKELIEFMSLIERKVGVPITLLSTGRERTSMVRI